MQMATVVVSTENVCAVLQKSITNIDEQMKATCLKYISDHAKSVLESDDFLELPRNCLVEVLDTHALNLPEKDIFEYVLKWARKECMRKKLDPKKGADLKRILSKAVLENIRFAQMDQSYFVDQVSTLNILSERDIKVTMRYFLSNRALTPDLPRTQRIVFERFRRYLSGKGYFRGNADAIFFSVSEDVKLLEVFVYGSCQHEGQYKAELNIKDGTNSLYTKIFEIKTDGFTMIYPISLETPVQLTKEKQYNLWMVMSGTASYYGDGGIRQLVSEGVTIKFATNIDGLNRTTVDHGQFPGLVFEK